MKFIACLWLAVLGVIPAEVAPPLDWPKNQALPSFPPPAENLDAIAIHGLSPDELITFSALQGQINRRQPRLFLVNQRSEEGADTWPDTLNLGPRHLFSVDQRDDLIAKYASEIEGAVLYDPTRSAHMRNLAGTAAALKNALPLTREIHERLAQKGTDFKIIVDLTTLNLESPLAIYDHLYQKYWPQCTKRTILSARPDDRGGDHHHTRDLASAVGAAVIWLDARIPAEREMLRKFYRDMTAGEAIALGWYPTERSGITTASEFGIGTMPSDHFMNASIYAGGDHHIKIPLIPKLPELEKKTYIVLFISDGDNIQYNQHAMRRVWDGQKEARGKVALNWTIAPGLVDIAPGFLNYYYATATAKDCFVTGPSGMGYVMPFNTLEEPGAPVGSYLSDPKRMDGYAALTQTYLQRSGLRVMTIWDDATPMQRASYEAQCRHLYGATIQNFKDVPSVKSSLENNRLPFNKLTIPYASSADHLGGSIRQELRRWNQQSPNFLSYQVNIWKELKPDRLVQLTKELQSEFPNQIEFIRADHYFNLLNKANATPYNLALEPATATRSTSASEVTMDLKQASQINRVLLQFPPLDDANGISVQVSLDHENWTSLQLPEVDKYILDLEFPTLDARYLRVITSKPLLTMADIEVYGTQPLAEIATSAIERADQAQKSLMEGFRKNDSPLFSNSSPESRRNQQFHYWWQAQAVDVLIDKYERTRSMAALAQAKLLFEGIQKQNRGLTNDYRDDMLWLALALLRLHDHLPNPEIKSAIETLWLDVQKGWSDSHGGGIAWRVQQPDYKALPGNAPAVILASRLYQRFKNPADLAWARKIQKWIDETLVDPESGFVWDGINRNGRGQVDRHWKFTYNQGVVIGAYLELYTATRDANWLAKAHRTARAALEHWTGPEGGILSETGQGDGALFKGIFVRYLGLLIEKDPGQSGPYKTLLTKSADSLWKNSEGPSPIRFPSDWKNGQRPNDTELSSQLSAVMLFEQVARLKQTPPTKNAGP